MDTAILEDLGLSKGEIQVYMTLLEMGTNKVGPIIEKSGMASSAVHNALNTLIDKGLVSYIKRSKVKFYQPAPPKQLVDFVEAKKNILLQLLPQLEDRQKTDQDLQEAEIFEGHKGIRTMLNELIEEATPREEYLFFAINVAEQNKDIQQFFRHYDIKRENKGISVKGLAPIELRKWFEGRKTLHVKYSSFPIPSNISICGSKIAFFSWGEKPVGYLIQSKQIAHMYKDYFLKSWEIC